MIPFLLGLRQIFRGEELLNFEPLFFWFSKGELLVSGMVQILYILMIVGFSNQNKGEDSNS